MAPNDPFARLTWDDVEEWAGNAIVHRGRGYRRDGAVRDLARTVDGALLAWVHGTHRYVTRVTISNHKELESECTCPYWAACKHAVAVILTYLDCLKEEKPVDTVGEDDPRLERLEQGAGMEEDFNDGWDDEDWGEDDRDEDDWGEDEEADTELAPPTRRSPRTSSPLRDYLQEHTKAELVSLLEETAREVPEVRQLLEDHRTFSSGRTRKMLQTVRREIAGLEEPAWDEYEYDYSHGRTVANLDRLQKYLHALVEAGRADDVLRLGPELLQAGSRAVEHEHEGESSYQLSACLDTVFQALPSSSLSPAEQLEWAIEMVRVDEYSLCDDAIDKLWETGYTESDWSELADRLQKRLAALEKPGDADGFEVRYNRGRLSNWLIAALEKAGRKREVIPLCEREAPLTGSYVRLVDCLIAASRWEEAARWCLQGIEDTDVSSPETGLFLRERLLTISERTGDRRRAAAFRAGTFFSSPSLSTFHELCKAARRARVGKAVEAWARHFLETGRKPAGAVGRKKRKADPDLGWPLPDTGVPPKGRGFVPDAPMTGVLIEIAIAEKRMLSPAPASSSSGRPTWARFAAKTSAGPAERTTGNFRLQRQQHRQRLQPGKVGCHN